MRKYWFIGITFATLLAAGAVRAQTEDQIRQIVDSLQYQHNPVQLNHGLATVTPTQNLSFLDGKDTAKFLTDVWGNSPETSEGVLGSIVPNDVSLADAGGWAIIITYEDSGHVSDEEATTIDYDELLAEMQQSIRDENDERARQGYSRYELLGWAEPPRYDAVAKKLYWAQRLKFEDAEGETLNSEIRALGRSGVLALNVVASMADLAMIQGRIDEILATVQFNAGNTYAEFNPDTDKVAAYGLAGLIAGGVLAKVGFFKWLLLSVLAFKKFFIIGAVAAFAAVVGWFRRRQA